MNQSICLTTQEEQSANLNVSFSIYIKLIEGHTNMKAYNHKDIIVSNLEGF